MNSLICIFMQDDGKLVSFLKATKIVVFKKSDVWREINTIILIEPYSTNPIKLRQHILNIISQLEDCKIIAGSELIGIPYCVFDGNGFSIFSITEISDEVLDGIIADIKVTDLQINMKNEIIKNAMPVETEISGVYYLDLVMLQTECPEISSKKALKNFLSNTPFIELQLLCNHIPPWIENGNYDIASTKTSNDKFLAIITNKLCKEDF